MLPQADHSFVYSMWTKAKHIDLTYLTTYRKYQWRQCEIFNNSTKYPNVHAHTEHDDWVSKWHAYTKPHALIVAVFVDSVTAQQVTFATFNFYIPSNTKIMLKSYKPDRAKVGSSQERPGFDHMAAFVAFMVEFWRECACFHCSTQVTHCDS